MTERILRATPLSVAIAAVLPVLAAIAVFSNKTAFAVILFSAIASFLGWCWMVGEALNRLIPARRRPSLRAFRLCTMGCIGYAAVFVAGLVGIGPVSMGQFPLVLPLLHVAAALAIVKIMRVIAFNLSLAEAEAQLPPMGWGTMPLALSPIAGMPLLQRRIKRLFDLASRDG